MISGRKIKQFTASDNFWQLARLPLIGHLHLFPKCRYEVSEFLIGHANQALREGHNVMCWWFATELNLWALDSQSAKEILENSVELTKGNDYAFFRQWLGERRILTPTFHFAKLEQYTHIFNAEARKLVDK
uniref:Glyco_hydro_57 domain-containing protein n=1 Tax=Globodera pallida TaxID=36090 RepID=A0A183BJZ6_GLOPA